MGYLAQIRKAVGRALRLAHRAGGFRAVYTLVTDPAADPMAAEELIVHLRPAGEVRAGARTGGRRREVPAEEGRAFDISREALKLDGEYAQPTLHDSFVPLGAGDTAWRVIKVESIGEGEAGWRLTCAAVYRQSGAG